MKVILLSHCLYRLLIATYLHSRDPNRFKDRCNQIKNHIIFTQVQKHSTEKYTRSQFLFFPRITTHFEKNESKLYKSDIIVRFIYSNFLSGKICKQVYLFIIYCYSRKRLGAKWNRFLLRLSCDFNPPLAVSFGELTSKSYWLFNNQRQQSHKWHLCFQNNFADRYCSFLRMDSTTQQNRELRTKCQ